MTLYEAMKARHSVRRFLDKPIEKNKAAALRAAIEDANKNSGLHMQLVLDEPKAFGSLLTHYGMFRGCTDYIAVVGRPGMEEAAGYWGEKIVLLAQTLGLNSCWVAATYSKNKVPAEIGDGEKLSIVIALGYGANQGSAHKNKPMESLYSASNPPQWFLRGMEAVMLAPTAVNQQKFHFTHYGRAVLAEAGKGPCSEIDLGIVKYHFELGAGVENFTWA